MKRDGEIFSFPLFYYFLIMYEVALSKNLVIFTIKFDTTSPYMLSFKHKETNKKAFPSFVLIFPLKQ